MNPRRGWLRALGALPLAAALPARASGPRVLHVMSYRGDWQWNRDQLRGFLEGLQLDPDLRVVELDAKHAEPGHARAVATEALALLARWRPDLVYANDDIAQSEFGVPALAAGVPLVYSGVNRDHASYGYDRAPQVTGVLEREHFGPTLALLRALTPPRPRWRLAMVIDDDPTWVGVAERLRAEAAQMPDVELVEWLQPRRLVDYQDRVRALQTEVDALGLLGVFRFAGSDGRPVDYADVLRWTAQHSRLPDFSFWDTRVERGTLCAVTVDGVEQGREAGRLARRILLEGVVPSSLPPRATARGRPMVSLARARALGLKLPASVLLEARVLPRYHWE